MSEFDAKGEGSSLMTVAAVAAGACLLVLLIGLVNRVTFGSLGLTLAILGLAIGGAVVFYLSRIEPAPALEGTASADDVAPDGEIAGETADQREDRMVREELLQLARSTASGSEAAAQQDSAIQRRKTDEDEFERIMAKRDDALENLLSDAKSKGTVKKSALGSKLQERVEKLTRELDKHNRVHEPLVWAAIMHALGEARLDQAMHSANTGQFGDTVKAVRVFRYAIQDFRRALKIRTKDRVPLEYAASHLALAETLVELGRREPGDYASDAVESLREALLIFPEASEEATRARTLLDSAERLEEMRKDSDAEPLSDF